MYKVAIRKNDTGEVRIKKYDFEWSLFWWTEGNMGCDCNRGVEFGRAGGEDPESGHLDLTWDCDDSRYSVLYAELEDGMRIPIDDGEDS